MQQLIDFLPLLAFFVSFKLGGIYVATGTLIAACAVQIGWQWMRTRKVKTLHWVTGVLVLVFGSATLFLKDPRFIQWKLTVLMWLLAASFLLSQWVGAKPLSRRFLESVLGEQLGTASTGAWSRLNLLWVLYFALVGALNLYVAYQFSQNVWVNFKVFGVGALTFLFLLPQVIWLMPKEATPETSQKVPAGGGLAEPLSGQKNGRR
jgi:intracellular septation protein